MAKYHYNVYPIFPDKFFQSVFFLSEFFSDFDPKFPLLLGHVHSLSDLKSLLKQIPENACYMVFRGDRSFFVYVIPVTHSLSAIEFLINNGFVDKDFLFRDVGYYRLSTVINDLPYNYHYIIQRYYE